MDGGHTGRQYCGRFIIPTVVQAVPRAAVQVPGGAFSRAHFSMANFQAFMEALEQQILSAEATLQEMKSQIQDIKVPFTELKQILAENGLAVPAPVGMREAEWRRVSDQASCASSMDRESREVEMQDDAGSGATNGWMPDHQSDGVHMEGVYLYQGSRLC
ncbi:hypothetical protein EJ06DRAFT_28810 [Trichodelitschia bisporula]|uniref:Uncharacterized protein n=1 Tax=Trichodelitschia bisporula TaxID=703511 RepID=A0A6G1IBM4_9PEZI|nr:hypothetical protein EJ06DRAFT_28810 [Trichodelitschia bisporula]